MWPAIKALVFNPRTLLVAYIAGAVFYAVQLISFGIHPFVMPKHDTIPADIMSNPRYLDLYIGHYFTEYNNYKIFRASWFHLLGGTNLYTLYPDDHWDLYKYSPTFALFMGLLVHLPDYLGLALWNILNGITLFFAVRMLPFNTRTQCLLLWLLFNELLTCYTNTQSNGLMCALFVAAYACLQRDKSLWAALWLMLAVFIKVYGAIGFCMFLFYPGKIRGGLYALMWAVVLAALPLLVIPFGTLVWQYQNWYYMMAADVTTSLGMSVTGWLHSWFGLSTGYEYITITGIALFLLPLLRYRMYGNELYRLLLLAAMLIWVIIFNRKAESPTYIIAMAGVGIWYYSQPGARWRTILLVLVLIFTSFSTTDLFPRYIHAHFIKPYTIKAVPCIIVYCVILAELMLLKPAGKSEKIMPSQPALAAA